MLDRWVKRAFEQADPSRPTIAHSGVLPHLPQLDGTDSHLWLGWHRGEVDELAQRARALPRLVRFVSEFGAQSVPESASAYVDASAWPQLDWTSLAEHHGLEADVMRTRHPPEQFPSFAAWRGATQRYQADLLRRHIETLRRLKYRPTGGFCFSWLADAMPMISASVLDHDRVPKAAWAAVIAACRPVIVVCDALPASVHAGRHLTLDIHVVSDLREPLAATIAVTASWPGGSRQWGFRGEVEADDCALVGRVTIDVPAVAGELFVGLALDGRTASGEPVTATRRAGARIATPDGRRARDERSARRACRSLIGDVRRGRSGCSSARSAASTPGSSRGRRTTAAPRPDVSVPNVAAISSSMASARAANTGSRSSASGWLAADCLGLDRGVDLGQALVDATGVGEEERGAERPATMWLPGGAMPPRRASPRATARAAT